MDIINLQKYNGIRVWLFTCCTLIFAMAVIGAITRLTESGLSITEWHPISGALPPLSAVAWRHEYDLYRASPEFAAKHAWMSLGDFKHIFFWEWLHRLVGRLIGVVYALPLLYFTIRRRIPRGYGWPLLGILGLGFCQGLLGWWMVESGLVNRPSVSHFRLAAHLGLALFIYGCIYWVARSLGGQKSRAEIQKSGFLPFGWLAILLLITTMTWGAFTAGLHAGMLYNTYPLMSGHFTPPEPLNILREPAWVQFTHRWLAAMTGLVILLFAWRARERALAAMVVIQVCLGISTLLSYVWLPLAAAHQAGAIVLLTLLLRALQRRGKNPDTPPPPVPE